MLKCYEVDKNRDFELCVRSKKLTYAKRMFSSDPLSVIKIQLFTQSNIKHSDLVSKIFVFKTVRSILKVISKHIALHTSFVRNCTNCCNLITLKPSNISQAAGNARNESGIYFIYNIFICRYLNLIWFLFCV